LTPYRPQSRAPRPSPLSISGSVSDTDSNSDGSAPPTPTEAHATLQSLLYRGVGGLGRDDEPRNIIYIDLLPSNVSHGPTPIEAPSVPSQSGYNVTRVSQYPRHIHEIDPTVTLVSRSPMVAKSHFTVRSRAGVVHSEVTEMTLAGPNPEGAEGELLYSTKLAPAFWSELCRNQGGWLALIGMKRPLIFSSRSDTIHNYPKSHSGTVSRLHTTLPRGLQVHLSLSKWKRSCSTNFGQFSPR
jgi:transcriptional enhancer factor